MDTKKSANGKFYKNISEEIEQMIEQGTLQPGDKLPSLKELAERFGVSRATIREAFSALQGKGLIELRHGTGTFVAQTEIEKRLLAPLHAALLIGRNDLSNLHEVRMILEMAASRRAAENLTSQGYEEIAVALTEFEWAVSEADLVQADLRFHQAIAVASGNPVLQNLLMTITESLFDVISSVMSVMSISDITRDYREWAEAIREGQPERASRITERYFQKLGVALERPIRIALNKSDT